LDFVHQGSGNPGFSIYRYDRGTGEILDVEYWWADLSAANHQAQDDDPPVWVKQFSARKGYCMMDMSPASWQLLGESFVRNQTALDLFMTNYYKGVPPMQWSASAVGPLISCLVLSGTPEQRKACLTNTSVEDPYSEDLDLFIDFAVTNFIRSMIDEVFSSILIDGVDQVSDV